MSDQYETARDEIRSRIESLNGKINSRRESAKQDREAADAADVDAERMIRLRDQYEALLAQPSLTYSTESQTRLV